MAGVRHGQWNTGRLALALLAPALLAASPTVCAAPDAGPAVNAILAADARGFTLTAPGLMGFHGGFSARISVDGNTHVLASTDGAVVGPVRHLTEQTPYGMAEVTAATLSFANEPVEVMFRLGRVAGVAGVLAQAGIRNTSQAPVDLLSLMPVTLAGELSGEVTDWWVTNLHPNNDYLTRRVSEIGTRRTPAPPRRCGHPGGCRRQAASCLGKRQLVPRRRHRFVLRAGGDAHCLSQHHHHPQRQRPHRVGSNGPDGRGAG